MGSSRADRKTTAGPLLQQVGNHTHVLMGERSARQLQHTANVVASKDERPGQSSSAHPFSRALFPRNPWRTR
jgi:hypothetical protein